MSQAYIKPAAALPQFPADEFQLLTVNSTTGFVAGEKITGGTTGATAKVSGIVDSTTLRIKAVKPGAASNFASETITGNKSSATATVGGTPITLANKRRRDVAGTVTLVTEDHLTLTDRGFEKQYWNPKSTADRGFLAAGKSTIKFDSVATAIRMGASKSQSTDASTAPVLSYFGPSATSASVVYSKAAGSHIVFRINSNEALALTGTPAVSFSFSGTGTSIANAGIVSVIGDGTTATVTTSADHGFVVGQNVTIAGLTGLTGLNATAVITSVPTTKKFTYANATTGTGTLGSASVTLAALQYATLTNSDDFNMYFAYTLANNEATGALASTTAWVANGAVLNDVGATPTAVTPAPNGVWSPAVTGVTIVA